ncbi:MAG: hypothetical protein ACOYOU_03810 [Kiritimatiellia bacterium]
MNKTLTATLLLLASTLLVSCKDLASPKELARLAELHDIEYAPRHMDEANRTTNTILLKSEKTLLLAALSSAATRAYDPCDCIPSCAFKFVGTDHALDLHGDSTLKFDAVREYLCNRDDIQKLLRLIKDRSNTTSEGIRQPADGLSKPSR